MKANYKKTSLTPQEIFEKASSGIDITPEEREVLRRTLSHPESDTLTGKEKLKDSKENKSRVGTKLDASMGGYIPNVILPTAKTGIHIKPENKGKFTASAKRAGQSVQEHAKSVLGNPNATPLQKKRANFARNAAKWKHQDGGELQDGGNIPSADSAASYARSNMDEFAKGGYLPIYKTRNGKQPEIPTKKKSIAPGRLMQFGGSTNRSADSVESYENLKYEVTRNARKQYGGKVISADSVVKYENGSEEYNNKGIEKYQKGKPINQYQSRLDSYIREGLNPQQQRTNYDDSKGPTGYGFKYAGNNLSSNLGVEMDMMNNKPNMYGGLGYNGDKFNDNIEHKRGFGTKSTTGNLGYSNKGFNANVDYSNEYGKRFGASAGYHSPNVNVNASYVHNNNRPELGINAGYNNDKFNANVGYGYNSGKNTVSGNVGYNKGDYNFNVSGEKSPDNIEFKVGLNKRLGSRPVQQTRPIELPEFINEEKNIEEAAYPIPRAQKGLNVDNIKLQPIKTVPFYREGFLPSDSEFHTLTKNQKALLSKHNNLDKVRSWYEKYPEYMNMDEDRGVYGFADMMDSDITSEKRLNQYNKEQIDFDNSVKNNRDWYKNWYDKRAQLPEFKEVATNRSSLSDKDIKSVLSDGVNMTLKLYEDRSFSDELPFPKNFWRTPADAFASRKDNTAFYNTKFPPNTKYTDLNGKVQNSLVTHEEGHLRDFKYPQKNTINNLDYETVNWGKDESDPLTKILTKEDVNRFKNSLDSPNFTDYFLQPTEVRARLNVWRQRNNIDPLKKYTKEELKSIIDEDLKKGDLNNNIKELYNILNNDPDKLNYLNNSYVSNNKSNGIQTAQSGDYINGGREDNWVMPNKLFLANRQKGGNIPTIEDEGEMVDMKTITDKEKMTGPVVKGWRPNWKKMTAQARKLNAKTVRTNKGSIIYFNDDWSVKGVDESGLSSYQEGGRIKAQTGKVLNPSYSWSTGLSDPTPTGYDHLVGKINKGGFNSLNPSEKDAYTSMYNSNVGMMVLQPDNTFEVPYNKDYWDKIQFEVDEEKRKRKGEDAVRAGRDKFATGVAQGAGAMFMGAGEIASTPIAVITEFLSGRGDYRSALPNPQRILSGVGVGSYDGNHQQTPGSLVSDNPFISTAIDLPIDVMTGRAVSKYGPRAIKSLVKNKFKSEIDWDKWNKEIPNNKALVKEYNTIEQKTKRNGTWMKNQDGSAFKGTPEEFIQVNSNNFKKAFPEGYDVTFRGGNYYDPENNYSDTRMLFGSGENYENIAKNYAYNRYWGDLSKEIEYYHPDGSDIIHQHPYKENGKMYKYATDKNEHTLIGDAEGDTWKNVKQDEVREWLKEYYPNARVNEQKGELSINNPTHIFEDRVLTDNIATYMEKKGKPRAKIYNVHDGVDIDNNRIASEVHIINPKVAKVKSLRYNNGMFDLTNPNIYKGLAPIGIATGAAASQMQPRQEYQAGGLIASQYPDHNAGPSADSASTFNNIGRNYSRYQTGGRVPLTIDNEKHLIYRKESPTGNGEGVQGHIMVNHPSKDKGKWDTIDLTDISNYKVKTIQQGVDATKKWHEENPMQLGGTIRYEDNLYAEGGYTVRRSNERKGKTHVVTGPDGTKKYFGDPNMGERSNSKHGKDAFYARHATNLKNNPYFRAYARSTWKEGGEITQYKNGGQKDPTINCSKCGWSWKVSNAGSDALTCHKCGSTNNKIEMKNGGQMIKRADGSYSQRGLWDNIRANAGSGREPTKQMLEQERKIKAQKGEYIGSNYNPMSFQQPGYGVRRPEKFSDYTSRETAEVVGEAPEWLKKQRLLALSKQIQNEPTIDYKQMKPVYSTQDQSTRPNQFTHVGQDKPYLGYQEATPFNNTLAWNALEFVDPSGVTSYPDVYQAWSDGKFDYHDIIEPLSALPGVGYFGKFSKPVKAINLKKNGMGNIVYTTPGPGSLMKIPIAADRFDTMDDVYNDNVKPIFKNTEGFGPGDVKKKLGGNLTCHKCGGSIKMQTGGRACGCRHKQDGGNLPCHKCGGAHGLYKMCNGGMVQSFDVIDEQDVLAENDSRRFATKENSKPVGFKYSMMKINRI